MLLCHPVGNISSLSSLQPIPDSQVSPLPEKKSSLQKGVLTVIKVAAFILGLVLLAACLLPLLLVEIGVRCYLSLTGLQKNKPRILVLAAQEDPIHQKTISFALNTAKRRLHTEYEIDMHVVANIDDMNQKLTQGSNLAAVWIVGHGNPTEIHLQPKKNKATKQWEGVLWIRNANRLNFSHLPPHIPIILDACQTGATESPLSIAKAIAQVAQNHPVFAPTKSISEFNLVIRSLKNFPLEVEWRRPCFAKTDHPLDLAVASIWSILLSILPNSLFIHEKITKNISNELNSNYL